MKSISAIQAKFLRSKVSTIHTKIWNDTNTIIQNRIIRAINVLTDELFVLCFFNESYWWVITNKRLIISDGDEIKYLPLSSIDKVDILHILNGEVTKQEAQTLFLESQQE